MKLTTLTILMGLSLNVWAGDLTTSMDTLGGNRDLIKKAKAIDPNNRVRIVQNRAVDRSMRLELGLSYGGTSGGDPYIDTTNLGGSLDFHFNPRWSIGARYLSSSNRLNSEGERVYAEAEAASASATTSDDNKQFPGVDSVKDTTLGVISWYPTYGKLNLFDSAIAQFDMYLLAGGGQVRLHSNTTSPTWTAGGGIGVWMSQHFTSRLEARYQSYQDQPRGYQKRDIDLAVFSASIGFLL